MVKLGLGREEGMVGNVGMSVMWGWQQGGADGGWISAGGNGDDTKLGLLPVVGYSHKDNRFF